MDRYRCVSRYRAGELGFQPGDLLPDNPALVEHLLRDSPGSFEAIKAASQHESDATETVSDGGEGEVASVSASLASASPDPPAPAPVVVRRETAWTPKRTRVPR